MFEELSGTLLCGDLFTHTGGGPPVTEDDIVERAFAAEELFKGQTALTPSTAPTIRKLAGQCLKRVPLDKRLRLLGVRASGLARVDEIPAQRSF